MCAKPRLPAARPLVVSGSNVTFVFVNSFLSCSAPSQERSASVRYSGIDKAQVPDGPTSDGMPDAVAGKVVGDISVTLWLKEVTSTIVWILVLML